MFPQCTARDAACEAHHIQPWWDGGATALNNLVLLCNHHHTLIEPDRYNRPADRWTIHINPDTATPELTPPGRTLRFTQANADCHDHPPPEQPVPIKQVTHPPRQGPALGDPPAGVQRSKACEYPEQRRAII
ncbi:HNH endonuclease [Tessaracoccus sp.]